VCCSSGMDFVRMLYNNGTALTCWAYMLGQLVVNRENRQLAFMQEL
jgi:hypothetical protein